jgi:predicted signal transduction protein with EAL and GGDEF domain
MSISRPANADQLVALADTALYAAKQAGKAIIRMHEPAAQLTDVAEPSRQSSHTDQ